MKKLLKSKICRFCVLFMGPTDVLKMVEKSKFSATVHAQYMNSSLCLQLRVQTKEKKKKKRKNAPQDSAKNAESKRALSVTKSSIIFNINRHTTRGEL